MFDNTQLAALVASRLCHDLVEPMNAIIQGAEMLKGADGKVDPDALSLLDHGVAKAWAKLEFFRFALGAANDGEGTLEEARGAAERLFGVLKPDLVWSAPQVTLPRVGARIALNLMLIASECLARGGKVEIAASEKDGGVEIAIIATGPRANLRANTAAALRGETPDDGFSGHSVQPALTGLLARQAGIELIARESEERVELALRSPAFKL